MGSNEHPARPEQTDHGFEEGQAKDKHKEDEPRPDFASGQAHGAGGEREDVIPRFSRGQEKPDGSEEKSVERRFSEGQER